jgi:hypothetical protein
VGGRNKRREGGRERERVDGMNKGDETEGRGKSPLKILES